MVMYDDGEIGATKSPAATRAGGPRFLTELAELARSTGRPVIEMDGWRTRTRRGDPSGYQPGRPNHVFVHHTASNPGSDGNSDATYIATRSSSAPISNFYINRAGTIWVVAAGPTNTEGVGSCSSRDGTAAWDGQGVPDDAMNSFAVSIECANNGTGEPWPIALLEATTALVQALQAGLSIPTVRVRGHHEWTRRKIDPAGPSPWATGSRSWDMNRFRADLTPTTPPPSPPGDDEPMLYVTNHNGAIWVGDGITRRHVGNEPQFGALRWGTAVNGRPFRDWRTGLANPELMQVTSCTDEELAALGVPV